MSEIGLSTLMLATQTDEASAPARLSTLLYTELHKMAQRELRRGAGVDLSPTTLLHETFLNISHCESMSFTDRGQFMSYAARAMRGLIIDCLRSFDETAESHGVSERTVQRDRGKARLLLNRLINDAEAALRVAL